MYPYLLIVEEVFDESIRLLYALKKIRDGKEVKITLKSIGDKSLWAIKKERALPEIFFKGLENGHLRNAIAHARIKYDENTGKMNFQDYDVRKRIIAYNRVLTLEEFRIFGWKLFQIPVLFLYALKALRVRDMVFSENPFID